MISVPQLNDNMPDFHAMKRLDLIAVVEHLCAYFMKRLIDVSGYAFLLILAGIVAVKIAESAIK